MLQQSLYHTGASHCMILHTTPCRSFAPDIACTHIHERLPSLVVPTLQHCEISSSWITTLGVGASCNWSGLSAQGGATTLHGRCKPTQQHEMLIHKQGLRMQRFSCKMCWCCTKHPGCKQTSLYYLVAGQHKQPNTCIRADQHPAPVAREESALCMQGKSLTGGRCTRTCHTVGVRRGVSCCLHFH